MHQLPDYGKIDSRFKTICVEGTKTGGRRKVCVNCVIFRTDTVLLNSAVQRYRKNQISKLKKSI